MHQIKFKYFRFPPTHKSFFKNDSWQHKSTQSQKVVKKISKTFFYNKSRLKFTSVRRVVKCKMIKWYFEKSIICIPKEIRRSEPFVIFNFKDKKISIIGGFHLLWVFDVKTQVNSQLQIFLLLGVRNKDSEKMWKIWFSG